MAEKGISRDEWEQVVNDIKSIRASTQSMNRIMVMNNRSIIVRDILDAIGGSPLRAAALYLTREPIPRADLAREMGVAPNNLNRTIQPLLDKHYLVPYRCGGSNKVFYRREEKVDLVGYDSMDEVVVLLNKWRARECEEQR